MGPAGCGKDGTERTGMGIGLGVGIASNVGGRGLHEGGVSQVGARLRRWAGPARGLPDRAAGAWPGREGAWP